MVARALEPLKQPRIQFRGPIYTEFLRPLQEYRWAAFSAPEVMIEGGTGTGKTLGLGCYLRNCLRMFPRSHWLVIRKYKADLPGSWMQTWEDEVLDPTDPWDDYMLQGPSRENRGTYVYPNGATVWLRGMDQWSRVKSMAFDGVWAVEGTELKEEHAQGLQSRLRPRRGVWVPFRQLLYDVNPGPPDHWLNQRCIRGVCRRITTTIKHNPGYWDIRTNRPTEDGREYIERMLSQLDGHNLQRLWFCKWAAATGMILTRYAPATHTFSGYIESRDGALDELVLNAPHPVLQPRIKIGWYLASMDWGRRHAGTLQLWAIDTNGRQYLIEEFYHSERNIFWWGEIAADVARRYGAGKPGVTLKAIVCDNAWPDNISYINDLLSKNLGADAACAIPCKKAARGDDWSNLEVLRAGFEGEIFGVPDIYISTRSLQHAPDYALPHKRLLDEIPAYCYARHDDSRSTGRIKDEPDQSCVDDGLDATTYARVYVIGGRRNFTPRITDWQAWNPRAADLVNKKLGRRTFPGVN